ncbi:outer membrane protein assembly factor BamB family protein [Halosegnis longus]|uniref:outer membrane protein assembly factor BamB family protein n=1 Tax=Halosegnis longus TaxID=2216012 RepID=UPI00096A89FA|nr:MULTISPECIES: PQQ-binding-like beta-propeller repeat protein [Halobacteriales]
MGEDSVNPTHRGMAVGSPGSTVEVAWERQFEGEFATLATDGETLYVTDGTRLSALSPHGETKWESDLPAGPTYVPAIAGDLLYTTGDDGALYAIALTTGAVQWRFSPRKHLYGGPAVGDGYVFVTDNHGTIHAIDQKAGERVWKWTFQDSTTGPVTPAAAQQTVYCTGKMGPLAALDTSDGSLRWQLSTEGAPRSVTVLDDVIVYPTDSTVIAAASPAGTKQWRTDLGSHLASHGAPAVVGDTVYATTTNMAPDIEATTNRGTVHALDLATGGETWSFEAPGLVETLPVVVGDTVLVGCHDGTLYALDRATGTINWSQQLGGQVTVTPVVAGETIYVGAASGEQITIFALRDPSTGSVAQTNSSGTNVYERDSDSTQVYCVECGTALTAQPTPDFCPHCGAKQ